VHPSLREFCRRFVILLRKNQFRVIKVLSFNVLPVDRRLLLPLRNGRQKSSKKEL